MDFDNIQSNFTAGEISPDLWGRVELEKYFFGCALLENMIVQPSGGVKRRGGFRYIADVKDSTKATLLLQFNYRNEYSYILEMGDLYIRFYVNRAQIMDGASPYEIVTTYTESELSDIRITQDTDTVYITHKNHTPATLSRTAHDAWTLTDIEFETDYAYTHEWELQRSSTNYDWQSVCWSPELELFVAVANKEGSTWRIMSSPDGKTWTTRYAGIDRNWTSVCWSPGYTRFVAVAESGTGNRVITSDDGITWTARVTPADNDWQSVCWSQDLVVFVAVANSGTGNRVMTSPDGITWTLRNSAADSDWSSVCWSPELALFTAIATAGANSRVMTSSDGYAWVHGTPSRNSHLSVCWSPKLSLFVAVAMSGTNRVMTSPDGITWTPRTATGLLWVSVCWSPELELFVAIAYASNYTMTSPDGITWTNRITPASEYWQAVCWSPELNLFCAVAGSGGSRVITSPDGITWTLRTAAAGNNWQSICWSSELTLFVVVAYSGTGDRVMTSPDGITWTSQTSAADYEWRSVCWSSDVSLFVAVASTGATSRVMTSANGITWVLRTSAVNDWHSICWSPEVSSFVAVAYSGAEDRVMTSRDGVSWTHQVSAAPNDWKSVCWSPELSLFVAVASGGADSRVMLSSNGTVWHYGTPVDADNSWTSICWSPKLLLFAAVSSVGTGDKIMTSPDGLIWTRRVPTVDNNWKSVCWSPEVELFVAVADTGVGDRITTSSDGITWVAQESAADYKWNAVCWSPGLSCFVAVASSGVGKRVMISSAESNVDWAANNYPILNWFYEQRHFFATTPSEPNAIWGSQSAEYANLKLGTGLDNEGLKFLIKAAYKFLWVSAGQEILLGGSNAEFKLAANAFNEALTPSNARPVVQTSFGSSFLPPLRIDDGVVFVQQGERKFRRLAHQTATGGYSDSYGASDITILSSHITYSGIGGVVCSTLPNNLIWSFRNDGKLIGLTYEPEHNVYGWHRHLIGGVDAKVKSLAVSPAVEGDDRDELWAVIEHTINGSTAKYIAYMEEGLGEEDDVEDAFFVDAGVTKTGSAFTTVDGLDHLEGAEVQVLGDGAVQAPKTVVSGEITLDQAVDKAQVGLAYTSALETLPIEGGNPIGTSQGKLKRIKKVSLRLNRSLGFSLGDVNGNLDTYYFGETVMDEPVSLFTGDTDPMPFAGSYDVQSRVRIVHTNPLPFNILAIMYQART